MKIFNPSILFALFLASGNEAHAGLQEANDAYRKGEYPVALKEFKKLAAAGAVQEKLSAQYMLGVMYANGDGVKLDYAEAAMWYRKAAEQGDAKAQFNLGVRYANGQGVALDYAEAVSWYSRAAEQGLASAQNNLGMMYYSGQGVQRDLIQAYKWISLSSAAGNLTAVDNAKVAEANMSPAQIEEARSLVLDWRPLHSLHASPTQVRGVNGRSSAANEMVVELASPDMPIEMNVVHGPIFQSIKQPNEPSIAPVQIEKTQPVIQEPPVLHDAAPLPVQAQGIKENDNAAQVDNSKVAEANMTPAQIEEARSLVLGWRPLHGMDASPARTLAINGRSSAAEEMVVEHASPDIAIEGNVAHAPMFPSIKQPNGADIAPVQIEKTQPVIQKTPVLHDAAALPVQAQGIKENDNTALEQHMAFLPPAPAHVPAPLVASSQVVAYSQSTRSPKDDSREAGYNGNSASPSPPLHALLDISLARAIEIAKEASFRLGRSRRNIDGALARYQAASSMYRPRFDSSTFATQSNHEASGGGPGMVPQFGATLSLGVTQPLDIGGVIGRQVSQAELARRAAEYDLAQSHLDVSLEVEINYYNALRAQEIVRVDQQDVGDLERLAAGVGEAPDGISDFVKVELANARQTLTSSRTILDLSLDTLKQSLRLAPETAIRLTDRFGSGVVAMDSAQALQDALAKRPDIGQIGVRIEQTRLAAEQVYDVRKPTLNLQLFSNNAYYSRALGNSAGYPLTYDRGVMVTLNMPLVYFDWGYLSETKRAALLQNEQAQFDLQEQRERVGLEVRQAMIAFKRAEQRVNTLPDLALAQDALKRAESDFLAAGRKVDSAILAQMSNARASRRLAETVTIDALYEYNIAIFNLEHAIGAFPEMMVVLAEGSRKHP